MSEHLKHLLDIESLSKEQILAILARAKQFYSSPTSKDNKIILANKLIMNLFFENSTRTRSSFEVAAKRLGANVINFNIEHSSTKKGETLLDTLNNLSAMDANLFIVRHPSSGAAHFLSEHLKTEAAIVNAGDGCHQHPSQGLLDLFAIQYYKKNFDSLKIAVVGDILHSRVARSLIQGLRILGTRKIMVVGPKTLIPESVTSLGADISYDLKRGIEQADVIVILRLQKERMTSVYLPSEAEYRYLYGIDQQRLQYAKPDVILMHPGPINRGVELTSEVVDGPQSIILKQVSFGVAVRMAIMMLLLNPGATS